MATDYRPSPARKDQGGPAVKGHCYGTHRLIAPEVTITRLRGLFPLMGITRIANVTGLDSIGIPVVMVCRPNSRALAVSQGKGADLASAKASGLMESIESFHAERILLPLKLGSHKELRFSHPLIDLDRLPRPDYSIFHSDLSLLWIEGTDLLSGEQRWLPHETVHSDFRVPPPPGSGAFFQSSNGLASGNHRLEAISHAICELVERDASSLWQASDPASQLRCRLDLTSVDDPGCREVLTRYECAGIAVGVWETTSDVGLPSFDCLIVDQSPDPLHPLPAAFGAGCHPTREIALMRAVTEAAQSRLTSISGSRDDMDRPHHERAHQWDVLRAVQEFIAHGEGRRCFQQAPSYPSASFDEDVTLELDLLRRIGIEEVVAVDLTKPELDIPVVKVVIPGLEFPHRMAGYVPGRRAQAVSEGSSGP